MPVSDSAFDYGRYLASREWAVLKRGVRARSFGICERCRRAPYEQTHHVTYTRRGQERLEDLLGVCRPCHEYLSAQRDDDPKLWYMGRIDLGMCLPCEHCNCVMGVTCPWGGVFWINARYTLRTDVSGLLALIHDHCMYAKAKGNGDCDLVLVCAYTPQGNYCRCHCCAATSDIMVKPQERHP